MPTERLGASYKHCASAAAKGRIGAKGQTPPLLGQQSIWTAIIGLTPILTSGLEIHRQRCMTDTDRFAPPLLPGWQEIILYVLRFGE
jgi:hypothetical protein